MVYDHQGNVFKAIDEMCKYWNISKRTYESRISKGMTVEKALITPCRTYKVKDHTGREFNNLDEMCKHWNISKSFYARRIKLGMTVEEALTTSYPRQHSSTLLKEISKQIKNNRLIDHLGNEYSSLELMCAKYGIEPKLFMSRIKSKWSVERALTEIPRNKKRKRWASIKEQANKNGISSGALYSRLARGMSVEEATSKPLQHKTNSEYSYNGKCYNSLTELCREYNVSYDVVCYRVNTGWDLESAIETPVKTYMKIKDHTGREFDTKVEMCKHWGISVVTYNSRIRSRWTKEAALTTPLQIEKIHLEIIIFGERYNDIPSISNRFGLNIQTIYNRFSKNYDKYKCIDTELVAALHRKLYNIKLGFVGLDRQARYQVPWSKEYQTTRQIIQHERPDLLELYDKAHPKGEWNPYRREGD